MSTLPECNTLYDDKQYYDNDVGKTAGSLLGGGLQVAFSGPSAALFLLLTAIGCLWKGRNACTWVLAIFAAISVIITGVGFYRLKTYNNHWTTDCTHNPRLKETTSAETTKES